MKVTGPGGMTSAQGPRGARGAGGEGFRLISPGAAAGAGPAASVGAATGVVGVAALIALQDVGGPLERRRRAVGRASRILDVLDDIKLALLDGGLSGHDLQRLRSAVADARSATDDAGLEALLDDVELRAAVEAAKLEAATSRS